MEQTHPWGITAWLGGVQRPSCPVSLRGRAGKSQQDAEMQGHGLHGERDIEHQPAAVKPRSAIKAGMIKRRG